jgi:hypothetical protein
MSARAQEAYRSLTDREILLLRRLFEIGSDDFRSFEPQLEGMRARRSCSCGCPSIELQISEGVPLGVNRGERIVGDFKGESTVGNPLGILIFQVEGNLVELEVYSMDGLAEGEFGLPQLSSLQVLEWVTSPQHPNIRIPKSPE